MGCVLVKMIAHVPVVGSIEASWGSAQVKPFPGNVEVKVSSTLPSIA